VSLESGQRIVALDQLEESGDNPRTITDERYEALKYSLNKDPDMLQARPIIATPEGEVVCGNMRLRAVRDLGWTEATVFVKELNPAQRREWMLRDNQEYGDWVPDELAAILAAHRDDQADMKLLGFGDEQMTSLLRMHDGTDGAQDNPDMTGAEPEVWGVVVECESEDQQAHLTEELTERGLTCRALIP
jgi:ParB-like chromosome segregation protein Spo0J